MAVKSFDEERDDVIVTIHIGRRSDLLKIPGVEPHMFPERGKKRKCRGLECPRLRARDPGWYATTLRPGGRWRVAVHKQPLEHPAVGKSADAGRNHDAMTTARRQPRRNSPHAASRLSDEAIDLAESWSMLDEKLRGAYRNMIRSSVGFSDFNSPTLRALYANANPHRQDWYEREKGSS